MEAATTEAPTTNTSTTEEAAGEGSALEGAEKEGEELVEEVLNPVNETLSSVLEPVDDVLDGVAPEGTSHDVLHVFMGLLLLLLLCCCCCWSLGFDNETKDVHSETHRNELERLVTEQFTIRREENMEGQGGTFDFLCCSGSSERRHASSQNSSPRTLGPMAYPSPTRRQ